jgi:hypothetical protein
MEEVQDSNDDCQCRKYEDYGEYDIDGEYADEQYAIACMRPRLIDTDEQKCITRIKNKVRIQL